MDITFSSFYLQGIVANKILSRGQNSGEIPRTPIAGAPTYADSTFLAHRNPDYTVDFSCSRLTLKTSTPYTRTVQNKSNSPPHADATFVVYHTHNIGKTLLEKDEILEGEDSLLVEQTRQIKKEEDQPKIAVQTFVKTPEEEMLEADKSGEKNHGEKWILKMDKEDEDEDEATVPEVVKPTKKQKGNQQKNEKLVTKAPLKGQQPVDKPSNELKENVEGFTKVVASNKAPSLEKVAVDPLARGNAEDVPDNHVEMSKKKGKGRKPKEPGNSISHIFIF